MTNVINKEQKLGILFKTVEAYNLVMTNLLCASNMIAQTNLEQGNDLIYDIILANNNKMIETSISLSDVILKNIDKIISENLTNKKGN